MLQRILKMLDIFYENDGFLLLHKLNITEREIRCRMGMTYNDC